MSFEVPFKRIHLLGGLRKNPKIKKPLQHNNHQGGLEWYAMRLFILSETRRGWKVQWFLKIDLENAYDRSQWDFIQETLLDVGLLEKMVEVTMRCIRSGSFKILWNGEPTEKIVPTRGIRQWDPFLPYIFVLCLEWLAHRTNLEIGKRKWKPSRASRGGPAISYLFFANDLILFADVSMEQVVVVKNYFLILQEPQGKRSILINPKSCFWKTRMAT